MSSMAQRSGSRPRRISNSTASSLYDLNTVWVGLFTLMIMGFALYYVIDIIERTILPWKQSNTTHQVQV